MSDLTDYPDLIARQETALAAHQKHLALLTHITAGFARPVATGHETTMLGRLAAEQDKVTAAKIELRRLLRAFRAQMIVREIEAASLYLEASVNVERTECRMAGATA